MGHLLFFVCSILLCFVTKLFYLAQCLQGSPMWLKVTAVSFEGGFQCPFDGPCAEREVPETEMQEGLM